MTIIAKRANGQPAYVAALPRKRQSDYDKPFNHAPIAPVPLWRRIWGVKP